MQTKETHTGRTYRWKNGLDGELDDIDSVTVFDSRTGETETHTVDQTPSEVSVENNPDGKGFSAMIKYADAQKEFWVDTKEVTVTYEDGTEELLFEMEE